MHLGPVGNMTARSPHKPPLSRANSWDPHHNQSAGALPNLTAYSGSSAPHMGLSFPMHGANSMEELQKLNLIQLAQDQYACALAQLNSAQSQVLAAAAILQGNGLILPPAMQQQQFCNNNDGAGINSCFANPFLPPFHLMAQPGGGGPRRELF